MSSKPNLRLSCLWMPNRSQKITLFANVQDSCISVFKHVARQKKFHKLYEDIISPEVGDSISMASLLLILLILSCLKTDFGIFDNLTT